MSNKKPQKERQNPFKREAVAFYVGGEEYQFKFIPAIHFQDLLLVINRAWAGVDFIGGEFVVRRGQEIEIGSLLANALNSQIYEIVHDVLDRQNGKQIPVCDLKREMSGREYAHFIKILITHGEIQACVQEISESLGESMAGMVEGVTRLAMQNSTQSDPKNSDTLPISSTEDSLKSNSPTFSEATDTTTSDDMDLLQKRTAQHKVLNSTTSQI